MSESSSGFSREEYLEFFREEVERCKTSGNWNAAIMRAWIHLQVAPEVILSADGQWRWKAIQERSKAGPLKPAHSWLFIEEEMQHYTQLVPAREIPRFKAGLLRVLSAMEIDGNGAGGNSAA